MDNAIEFVRIAFTVVCFVFFVLVLFFIFKRGSKHHYSSAAEDIFLDEDDVSNKSIQNDHS